MARDCCSRPGRTYREQISNRGINALSVDLQFRMSVAEQDLSEGLAFLLCFVRLQGSALT
jgi:hypothetical protein